MEVNLLKYDMIQWLMGLNTEKFSMLMDFRKQLEKEPPAPTFKPFSKAELIARAQLANKDIEEGRVIDIDELEKLYLQG